MRDFTHRRSHLFGSRKQVFMLRLGPQLAVQVIDFNLECPEITYRCLQLTGSYRGNKKLFLVVFLGEISLYFVNFFIYRIGKLRCQRITADGFFCITGNGPEISQFFEFPKTGGSQLEIVVGQRGLNFRVNPGQ